MYQLQHYRDAEDLKFNVASDPKIIRVLATFAHTLGFGWCVGTRAHTVGEDFEVRKEGDTYVLKAHYDSDDPYSYGHWPDKRLKITLSNFQITFDPATFVYGTPMAKDLQPLATKDFTLVNKSNAEDTFSKQIVYQLQETVTHTTNSSLTAGIKVAAKAGAQIPFFSGEVSTEYSFSASKGWSDSSAMTSSEQDSYTYTGQVPARSKRKIWILTKRKSSDISYTALAQVGFDIEFHGFLRGAGPGNARADHTDDRPFVTLRFGNGTLSGFEDIWDKWSHRDIPGYWKGWDWDWVQKNFGGIIGWAMRFIGDGIGAPTSGKFRDIKGTEVYTTAEEVEPIGMAELADAVNLAPALGVAEMDEMGRADEGENAPVADASMLDADEAPGARVISIE